MKRAELKEFRQAEAVKKALEKTANKALEEAAKKAQEQERPKQREFKKGEPMQTIPADLEKRMKAIEEAGRSRK